MISVAVMAHPERAAQVERLVARLGVPTVVEWDRGLGEWDTGARALRAASGDWHLVLQDDALICADLVAGLERLLAGETTERCYSLYFGRSRPYPAATTVAVEQADAHGAGWIVFGQLLWGVAILLPSAAARRIADADARGMHLYDMRVSFWLARQQMQVWYAWPSLVDHDDSLCSILMHGGGNDPRVAHRFVGERTSALDVDWGRPPLLIPDPRRPAQSLRQISRAPIVSQR